MYLMSQNLEDNISFRSPLPIVKWWRSTISSFCVESWFLSSFLGPNQITLSWQRSPYRNHQTTWYGSPDTSWCMRSSDEQRHRFLRDDNTVHYVPAETNTILSNSNKDVGLPQSWLKWSNYCNSFLAVHLYLKTEGLRQVSQPKEVIGMQNTK